MTRYIYLIILGLGVALIFGRGMSAPSTTDSPSSIPENAKSLVVAGGCFWCVEKDFESRSDVYEAISGFAGGDNRNATYRDHAGHREAVEIFYDGDAVTYAELLHFFLRSIDVTDAGGQFCDRGHEYSTAIYTRTEAERLAADAAIAEAASDLGEEVATVVEPLPFFVPAGAYHQDYYKSEAQILTRYGQLSKAEAYKRYRRGCGRDERVMALWGDAASTH